MSPGFDSSSFRFESWHELHSPSASPAPVSPPAHLHPYPQILVCNKTLGDVAQLIEQSALNRLVAGLIPVIPFWKMPPTGRQLVLKTRVRQRCRRGSIPPSSSHPPEAKKRGTVLITRGQKGQYLPGGLATIKTWGGRLIGMAPEKS